MNDTIKIKISLCPDYKVFCENCRYGENSTIEEYEEYLDDIVNAHIPFIDDVFVMDEVCEHCGANTLHVIAKLKIETVKENGNSQNTTINIGDIIIENPVGDVGALAKEINETLSSSGIQVLLSK